MLFEDWIAEISVIDCFNKWVIPRPKPSTPESTSIESSNYEFDIVKIKIESFLPTKFDQHFMSVMFERGSDITCWQDALSHSDYANNAVIKNLRRCYI